MLISKNVGLISPPKNIGLMGSPKAKKSGQQPKIYPIKFQKTGGQKKDSNSKLLHWLNYCWIWRLSFEACGTGALDSLCWQGFLMESSVLVLMSGQRNKKKRSCIQETRTVRGEKVHTWQNILRWLARICLGRCRWRGRCEDVDEGIDVCWWGSSRQP